MHIKSLRLFCDVVARRSFSRAAEENGLTQSAVSQVVHHLEERLGVRLLDRSRRPFVITSEGEIYYQGCREIVQLYDALEEEVRTPPEEVAGSVRVASIYSVGLTYLNQFTERFQAEHPNADVRVQFEHPLEVYESVKAGKVDVGIVSYPRESPNVTVSMWRQEPMVVVCIPGDQLTLRETVALDDLAGMAMIGFDTNLAIRREIDRTLKERGIEVQMAAEFDNIEAVKRAIEIGRGIGILPQPAIAREIEIGTLVTVPLEKPVLTRPVGVIQRRGKKQGKTARRFIEQLLEQTIFPAELKLPGKLTKAS